MPCRTNSRSIIDRRITLNEPHDDVIDLIKGLIPDYLQDEIVVEELFYDTPSYTGFSFPLEQIFPRLAAGRIPPAGAGRIEIHPGPVG